MHWIHILPTTITMVLTSSDLNGINFPLGFQWNHKPIKPSTCVIWYRQIPKNPQWNYFLVNHCGSSIMPKNMICKRESYIRPQTFLAQWISVWSSLVAWRAQSWINQILINQILEMEWLNLTVRNNINKHLARKSFGWDRDGIHGYLCTILLSNGHSFSLSSRFLLAAGPMRRDKLYTVCGAGSKKE